MADQLWMSDQIENIQNIKNIENIGRDGTVPEDGLFVCQKSPITLAKVHAWESGDIESQAQGHPSARHAQQIPLGQKAERRIASLKEQSKQNQSDIDALSVHDKDGKEADAKKLNAESGQHECEPRKLFDATEGSPRQCKTEEWDGIRSLHIGGSVETCTACNPNASNAEMNEEFFFEDPKIEHAPANPIDCNDQYKDANDENCFEDLNNKFGRSLDNPTAEGMVFKELPHLSYQCLEEDLSSDFYYYCSDSDSENEM